MVRAEPAGHPAQIAMRFIVMISEINFHFSVMMHDGIDDEGTANSNSCSDFDGCAGPTVCSVFIARLADVTTAQTVFFG